MFASSLETSNIIFKYFCSCLYIPSNKHTCIEVNLNRMFIVQQLQLVYPRKDASHVLGLWSEALDARLKVRITDRHRRAAEVLRIFLDNSVYTGSDTQLLHVARGIRAVARNADQGLGGMGPLQC